MYETDDQARERARRDAEKIREVWARGEAPPPLMPRPGWPAAGIIRSLADIEVLPEPDRTRVKRLRLQGQANTLRRINREEGQEAVNEALAAVGQAEGPEAAEQLRVAFLAGAEETHENHAAGPGAYAVEMARLVNEVLAEREAVRNFGTETGVES